jgi:transposase
MSSEGLCPTEVASEIGCSRALVYKVLHSAGREIPRREGRPKPLNRNQKERIISLSGKDLTIKEISAVTGGTYYQIRRHLRRRK